MVCLKDKINFGKYKNVSVNELIEIEGLNAKSVIMSLIKTGEQFCDDVLSSVGIKKKIRDVRTRSDEYSEKIADKKVYEKDDASINKILKELHTIDASLEKGDAYLNLS